MTKPPHQYLKPYNMPSSSNSMTKTKQSEMDKYWLEFLQLRIDEQEKSPQADMEWKIEHSGGYMSGYIPDFTSGEVNYPNKIEEDFWRWYMENKMKPSQEAQRAALEEKDG